MVLALCAVTIVASITGSATGLRCLDVNRPTVLVWTAERPFVFGSAVTLVITSWSTRQEVHGQSSMWSPSLGAVILTGAWLTVC